MKPFERHQRRPNMQSLTSNSNWTEQSTIQGVIAQVFYNYEHHYSLNCTTLGPDQLLINRIYNKFCN